MPISDSSDNVPSRAEFADLIIQGLVTAGDNRIVSYCEDPYSLTSEDSRYGRVNLENMYAEHCNLPDSERANHLKRVLLALLQVEFELPEDFEDARPDLRPKIWTRATFEMMKLTSEIENTKSLDLPLIPIGEHLLLGIVYDLPTSMRSINYENLETWGVTIYEALEAATHNLLESGFTLASIGDKLYASVIDDHYDCCRLLAQDILRSLKLTGDPVITLPNRSTLLITGSDDTEGLTMLADLTEKAFEEPRPMMSMALRLEGDDWIDWLPDHGHPLHQRFKLLKLRSMLGLYETQKELLDRLFEQRLEDVFVARLNAVTNNDDEVMTWCVWSESVTTLLPEADKIMFFRPEQNEMAQVRWDDAVRIAGTLMETVEDMYPTRFRVESFPSEEQFAALLAVADG